MMTRKNDSILEVATRSVATSYCTYCVYKKIKDKITIKISAPLLKSHPHGIIRRSRNAINIPHIPQVTNLLRRRPLLERKPPGHQRQHDLRFHHRQFLPNARPRASLERPEDASGQVRNVVFVEPAFGTEGLGVGTPELGGLKDYPLVDVDGGAVDAVLGAILAGEEEGLVRRGHPAGGTGGGLNAEGLFDYGCGVGHDGVGAEESFDSVLVVYRAEKFVVFGAQGFKGGSVLGQREVVKGPLESCGGCVESGKDESAQLISRFM